jgi:hypothetical protein
MDGNYEGGRLPECLVKSAYIKGELINIFLEEGKQCKHPESIRQIMWCSFPEISVHSHRNLKIAIAPSIETEAKCESGHARRKRDRRRRGGQRHHPHWIFLTRVVEVTILGLEEHMYKHLT